MFLFLLILQILVCVSIIGLVMIQQGKGADMGAAFGSGAAGTVFGAAGGGSFLTRATAILAAVFFVNCLLIASPLVRETGNTAVSISEVIEKQEAEKTAGKDTVNEAPQAGVPDAAVKKTETPATEGDLPDMPDVPPADAGNGDLPE